MLSKEMVNEEEESRLASERRIMFKDGEGKPESRDPYVKGKFVFVVRQGLAV